MHEEQAFLDQLMGDPSDDVTRLVYADWLEERGEVRGTYLRAEQQLAALSEDDPRFAALEREVAEQSRALDGNWLAIAGKSWDVWLVRSHPYLKLPLIAAIRRATACGLREGKDLIDAAPGPVVRACDRAQAETVRSSLLACRLHDPREPLPHVVVSIRPCPIPDLVTPASRSLSFDVMLLGARPGREAALRGTLRQLFSWHDEFANHALASSPPSHLQRYSLEADARAAAALLEESAEVEVRRFERLAIPRLALGRGDYDVWLTAFAAEHRASIIRAYREATGVGLAQAMKWAEQPPPLLVVKEVNRAAIEQLRGLFAGIGTLQVRTKPAL